MAAVERLGRALRRVGGGGRGREAPADTAATAPAKKVVVTAAKKAAAAKAPAAKKVAPAAKKAAAAKVPAAKKAAVSAKKAPAATKAAPAVKKVAPARKVAPATKVAVAKAAGKKVAVKETAVPKKAPARASTPPAPAGDTGDTGDRESAPGTEWTRSELAEIREQLSVNVAEMRIAYENLMRDLDALQRSSTDGSGDDQADAGAKTFEREQEQSIAANRFELLSQFEHAVERIDKGTYGLCESCGKPIPKARLKAFPAATLDVACKQREERR